MASNINPSNINGQYPIAGQDNDSQGFRDNFTNTRNNLTFAKTEIEDLQSKVVLKAALTGGGTVNNDLTNVLLKHAQTTGFSQSINPTALPTTGTVPITFGSGDLQKIEATTGPITLTFNNWPTSGQYGKIRVWVIAANIAHTVTFPLEVTIGIGNIVGVTGQVLTPAVGDYMFEFSTTDGGNTISVVQLVGPTGTTDIDYIAIAAITANVTTLQGNVTTLTSDLGNVTANVTTLQGNITSLNTYNNATVPTLATDPGTAGQVVSDGTWIYVCVSSGVWVRTAAATW